LPLPKKHIKKRKKGDSAMLHKIDNIVCSLDLTDNSTKVLQYALDLASRYYASLAVIYIMQQSEKPLMGAISQNISREKLLEIRHKMIEDNRYEFENLCKDENSKLIDKSVEMKSIFLIEGIAYKEIIAQAKKQNADLIVMGQYDYSDIDQGKLLGSTTLGVLLSSDIPVLCI
jgi:nucleotide-binding universal stress UspA family protein